MVITTANARRKWRHTCTSPAAWSAAAVACMLMPCAHAADWKVTPRLSLKETYTDNVTLAQPGAEVSDVITEISPGISITGTGSRLKANLHYDVQNRIHAKGQFNDTTNQHLNADAKAELVDDLFFLDSKAAISQQNISPFGAQNADNIYVTNNRTTVKTYSISPYLRQRYGSTASSELRYTHDGVESDTAGFANSQSDNILFALASGAAFKTLGWGIQYSDKKIRYQNIDTLEMEAASANLRYLITPKFALTASGGYESNSYLSTTGEKPQGYFWTAGFAWAPSTRTRIEASTGKHYYGDTYELAANHRSRNTVWNLSYNESITTTQSQFLIPGQVNTLDFLNGFFAYETDAKKRQDLVDNAIATFGLPAVLPNSVNYFTNRIFLQKKLQTAVAVNRAKSTLILSAFHTLRNALTAQSFDSSLFGTGNQALADRTRQFGSNALWSWRISPRTNVNTSAGYSRISSRDIGRIDHHRTVALGMTRQFQPKLKGGVELRQQQQTSNQNIGNYREHAITASLLMSF